VLAGLFIRRTQEARVCDARSLVVLAAPDKARGPPAQPA